MDHVFKHHKEIHSVFAAERPAEVIGGMNMQKFSLCGIYFQVVPCQAAGSQIEGFKLMPVVLIQFIATCSCTASGLSGSGSKRFGMNTTGTAASKKPLRWYTNMTERVMRTDSKESPEKYRSIKTGSCRLQGHHFRRPAKTRFPVLFAARDPLILNKTIIFVQFFSEYR
ncbi:MAG: hypothetical protein LBP25_01240 [Tannerellaceae bacterium]|jgi:hypothetical protein|nr:hypothetical protein [Tannerellaceae bacterium]